MSASRPKIGPKGLTGPRGPTGYTPMDASGNLDMSCNNILDVSNIYFCNGTAILGPYKDVSASDYPGLVSSDTVLPVLTISGELDMSCNCIIDISRAYFCDNIVLTAKAVGVTPSIILGTTAGFSSAAQTIGIGNNAGSISALNHFSISIGTSAGTTDQLNHAIAIGTTAGTTSQGSSSIAIGLNAGRTNQDTSSVSIGPFAGFTGQGYQSVAIGTDAGHTDQSFNCIAIGTSAGHTNQGTHGSSNLQGDAIAIGLFAGKTNQGGRSIALGPNAGETDQSNNSVAIGFHAGKTSQGTESIAIGQSAGFNLQGINAIAIGEGSGKTNQGTNAIAIGEKAGEINQSNNTIIINASGSALDTTGTSRCYVKPIRADVSDNVLYYDNNSGEITYGLVTPADVSGVVNQMAYITPDTTSVGSTPDAIINIANNQILYSNGSALKPVIGFQNSTSTGMYRDGSNVIGMSVDNNQKVTIAPAGMTPSGFINGLNIGNISSVAGLRRVSAISANSWEDGHLGNSDGIFFTPHDFNSNRLGSEYAVISSNTTRGITRNNPFIGVTASSTVINACKLIPKGFIINTECTIAIYTADADGSGTPPPRNLQRITGTELQLYTQGLRLETPSYDGDLLVSESSYDTNSTLSIQTDMSLPVLADGYTYVCISWDPKRQLSNTTLLPGLYGAYITMKRI